MDLEKIEKGLGALTQDSADQMLRWLGFELKYLDARELGCMILFGRVLLEVQDRDLWRGRWATWGAFLKDGVPAYLGRSGRTANDMMNLARSPALTSLPPAEVAKIASVGNAKRVARLERSGAPITPAVIQMAQEQTTQEFHRKTGASVGTKVQVWIADPAAAAAMQRLVDTLAGASAPAIQGLVDLLTSDRLTGYAGAGAENRLDAILGAVVTSVQEDLDYAVPQERPEVPLTTYQVGNELAGVALPYERVTGLEITVFHGTQQPFVALGYLNGNGAHPAAFGSGQTVELALQELRENRLRAVILEATQRQHFRCAGCDKVLPLQGHHIKFRSHGGTDVPENIEAVCAKCHHKRHHRKWPMKPGKFDGEEPMINCSHGEFLQDSQNSAVGS